MGRPTGPDRARPADAGGVRRRPDEDAYGGGASVGAASGLAAGAASAGAASPPVDGAPLVWLFRHGQTEWSANGRHTGRTDIPLTPAGEDQARALAPVVEALGFDMVLCSPRLRALCTAELAGLAPYEVTDDLQEWDYGAFEGRTSADIREELPDWTIWNGPWQGGETAEDVAARADRLIDRVRRSGASRVALVGHGHFSRVTGVRWVGAAVRAGRWLEFDTASWSRLGWDRGVPVLNHWNVPAQPS